MFTILSRNNDRAKLAEAALADLRALALKNPDHPIVEVALRNGAFSDKRQPRQQGNAPSTTQER